MLAAARQLTVNCCFAAAMGILENRKEPDMETVLAITGVSMR